MVHTYRSILPCTVPQTYILSCSVSFFVFSIFCQGKERPQHVKKKKVQNTAHENITAYPVEYHHPLFDQILVNACECVDHDSMCGNTEVCGTVLLQVLSNCVDQFHESIVRIYKLITRRYFVRQNTMRTIILLSLLMGRTRTLSRVTR